MPRQNLGRVKGDKGDPFTFDDFTSGQLDGITPKMVLGNVTTLGPDENAAVNMRNEGLKNYVDFAIPRGKNGAEAKNIPAENVEMADKTTLESAMATVNESVNTNNTEINKIKTPTFTDTVGTYTTLNAANTAAETASNAIKSKVNILTTLSNMKKSFSAIVQGLKILATNVGMIQGITSDLNSESDYIAASSKALATLNGNLQQSVNGKFVLPNGLKICWGNIGYGASLEVSFPFTFKQHPTVIAAGSYTNLETITQVVRVYDTTVAGFKCVNQYFSNTDGTVTHLHNSVSQGINWIAIGY